MTDKPHYPCYDNIYEEAKSMVRYIRRLAIIAEHDANFRDESQETVNLVNSILDKQIPKRVTDQHQPCCPQCGVWLGHMRYGNNFCYACGQAIDWSDDNAAD